MLAAAIVAGLFVLTMPVGLVETLVASSGLSEAIPAAGPPLGLKARLLLAGFGAMMAVGMVAAVRRRPADPTAIGWRKRIGAWRGFRAQGARRMGFAFAKLTALARGRNVPVVDEGTPALRRADAHPDAPARAPIFASRDFNGLDIFSRPETGRRRLVVNPEPGDRPAEPSIAFAMPSAPEPLPVEELNLAAFAVPADPEPAPEPVSMPLARPPFAAPEDAVFESWEDDAHSEDMANGDLVYESLATVDISSEPDAPTLAAIGMEQAISMPAMQPARKIEDMTLAELTERLERGLAQRSRHAAGPHPARVIADMPVASAVPVRDMVEQDVDEALRAALGTLRSMTGHGR
ncbi:hypothetical protein PMI04_004085 [Sphingobium sp. AP49]|uniref:hypothetical protein n=1 Tax=Sphingobium sp. AP49 TaxID=1144307 RepID=UPI0002F1FC5E|nr:hypothetical protein [Sphingobium sp. AP49]WHO39779.1 hypothetical protein PMI04_004085 [Sphingobium sp. AP49]